MSELETREFEVRLSDPETRQVSGIAVPLDTSTKVGNYNERIARGAVNVNGPLPMLMYGHTDPIGKVTAMRETDDGLEIDAQISKTARGDETYTLLRDGVLSKFSIGFLPVSQTRDASTNTVTRTGIDLREVSVVPIPAYAGASVKEVREDSATAQEATMTDEVTDAADLSEVRSSIEELDRKITTLSNIRVSEPTVTLDNRSAGEAIKALVAGDDNTIRAYQSALETRTYTGGTSADSPSIPVYLGDFTRLYDASTGVLASIFGTGDVPPSGNTVEFAILSTNTTAFAKQVNEGDTLAFGKISKQITSSSVYTYGGYTTLSRQEIERSSVPMLNDTLTAMTLQAAAANKAVLRASLNTLSAARLAIASYGGSILAGKTLANMTPIDWVNAVIKAQVAYESVNLVADALVVSQDVFTALAGYLDSTGRPIFSYNGDGSNSIGSINVQGLRLTVAGLLVVADTGAANGTANFVSGRAINNLTSPLVSLTGAQDVTTLTQSFSVFRYGAVTTPVPEGVWPLKLATS